MNRPCYHCNEREAAERSNFCPQCLPSSRPLFFPAGKSFSLLTVILYLAAFAAAVWAIVQTLIP